MIGLAAAVPSPHGPTCITTMNNSTSNLKPPVPERAVSCPNCGAPLYRWPRRLLMRLLPGSRHYRCYKCQRRYLQTLFGVTILLGTRS